MNMETATQVMMDQIMIQEKIERSCYDILSNFRIMMDLMMRRQEVAKEWNRCRSSDTTRKDNLQKMFEHYNEEIKKCLYI